MDEWLRIKEGTGIEQDGLKNRAKLPEKLEYLWIEFINISKGCTDIDYVGIDAYQRLTGTSLTNWEISVLVELDLIRCKSSV